MKVYRNLEPGDRIVCSGITVEIKEILFQDAYNCDWDESRSYYDIEFRDKNGKYRHWKSNLDGGSVIKKSGVTGDDALLPFKRREDEGYVIPFNRVTEEISDAILKLMKSNWVLFRGRGVGDYFLYPYSMSKRNKDIPTYRNVVRRLSRDMGVKLESGYMDGWLYSTFAVIVEDYFVDRRVSKFVDMALTITYGMKGNTCESPILALAMLGESYFCFVEVNPSDIF